MRLKGLNIHLVGSDGQPLPEYGTFVSGREASCFVESKTDSTFRIILRPEGGSVETRKPWQYLATLYLDGRKTAEARKIVYLDSSHRGFIGRTGGEVSMEGRKLKDRHGDVRLHRWVFKELGIHHMLKGPSIATSSAGEEQQSELASTIDSHEKSQAGFIKIVVDQIKVESDVSTDDQHSWIFNDKGGKGKRSCKNITHTTERTAGEPLTRKDTYMKYEHLVDTPVAIMTFHYRGAEALHSAIEPPPPGTTMTRQRTLPPPPGLSTSFGEQDTNELPFGKRQRRESNDQPQKKRKYEDSSSSDSSESSDSSDSSGSSDSSDSDDSEEDDYDSQDEVRFIGVD